MTQNDQNDKEDFLPSIPPAGPISSSFLARSVMTLVKRDALTVDETSSVREALDILRKEKTGCILVLRGAELVGIFTERDCILKVIASYCDGISEEPVSTFMTKDPITIEPDSPVAYALNLMSHGGFRHLPIVADGTILGLISVKDVVDGLVQSMVDEIENI